jgi:hypothetical protein
MATLKFKSPFKQWENWEEVTFCEEESEGDMVYFKITTNKKQIMVSMHKREWNLFLHQMPKYKGFGEKF